MESSARRNVADARIAWFSHAGGGERLLRRDQLLAQIGHFVRQVDQALREIDGAGVRDLEVAQRLLHGEPVELPIELGRGDVTSRISGEVPSHDTTTTIRR